VRIWLLIAGSLAIAGQAGVRPVQTPKPVEGRVTVGGQPFRTEYHFNHNALAQAVRVGTVVVARTSSGHLLRFNLRTLELTGELVCPVAATALGTDADGRLLVGDSAGHVDAIDPQSWDRQTVYAASGPIYWLGLWQDPLPRVVIVAAGHPEHSFEGWPGESRSSQRLAKLFDGLDDYAVIILGGEKPRVISRSPKRGQEEGGVRAIDSSGVMWVAADMGEFGGTLSQLDLKSGAARTERIGNIRGFARTGNGELLAYGGLTHMGMSDGFVATLGTATSPPLWEFTAGKPPTTSGPQGPIDHIVRMTNGPGYWVVSNQTVFTADEGLSSWKRIGSLGARWIAGSRLSVSNTQTISGVIVDPDTPQAIVAVTEQDGLIRISNSGVERRTFDGQLEIDVEQMWSTSVGLLLLPKGSGDGPSAWRLGARGWDGSLFDGVAKLGDWSRCTIVGDDGNGMTTICNGLYSSSPSKFVQVDDRGSARLSATPAGYGGGFNWILTPRAVLEVDVYSKLIRYGSKDPAIVGRARLPEITKSWPRNVSQGFLPIDRIDLTDYVLDGEFGSLLALREQRPGSFELLPARIGGQTGPPNLYDVYPDGDHWVLTASASQGLARLHLVDGELRRLTPPNRGEVFTSLTRDRQGRLWAAGQRLYTSIDEGATWAVVELPVRASDEIKVVRPAPGPGGGVWVSLGARGLVMIGWI